MQTQKQTQSQTPLAESHDPSGPVRTGCSPSWDICNSSHLGFELQNATLHCGQFDYLSPLEEGMTAFGAELWVLVMAQCLHSITFAAQHTACIALISRYFPGRLRGRGQALYSLIGYGLSGVIGGLGGAALASRFGYASVFWAASAAAVLTALCCWRSMQLDRRRLAGETPKPSSNSPVE